MMQHHKLNQSLAKTPVHIAVVLIALIWTLPTVGLLISSFRPSEDLLQTGWWTVLLHPFELTRLNLSNYGEVLTSEGMGQTFLNSFVITIPATVIPIAIAGVERGTTKRVNILR